MKPKHKRLIMVLTCLVSIGIGVTILLSHFNEQLIFYYSPSQLRTTSIPEGQVIRVGGLVAKASIEHRADNWVEFKLTDGEQEILVQYQGLLPNLFREEQGMVAQGTLEKDDSLKAMSLLAKHDENYMPPEVVKSLKETGRWKQAP